jgi:hypothetical protein
LGVAGPGSVDEVAAVRRALDAADRPSSRLLPAAVLLAWDVPDPALASEVAAAGVSSDRGLRIHARAVVREQAARGRDLAARLRGVPVPDEGQWDASVWRVLLHLAASRTPSPADLDALIPVLPGLDLSTAEEREIAAELDWLLESPDARVRAGGACALAHVGWAAAERGYVERLAAMASGDANPEARRAAEATLAVLRRRGLMPAAGPEGTASGRGNPAK